MRTDGPLIRRLPARIRVEAVHLPHAVVCLLAFFVLVFASATGGLPQAGALVMGLLTAAPILMTLVRPVGAFWAAVAVTLISSVVNSWDPNWPWAPATFVSYLATIALVAMRTSPRTAGWMWLVTVAIGTGASVMLSSGQSINVGPMAFTAAFVLLTVTIRNIRRQAEQEVTAQQEVTAVERDRRTLLEERTTIARELHDVVAHHMSVVAIQAEAAPYRVKNPPPELEAVFVTIRENAVAALTELRRVLGVVRSADYEAPDAPQPTLASLDGLLANVREAGMSVDKTVTGAVRELPPGWNCRPTGSSRRP